MSVQIEGLEKLYKKLGLDPIPIIAPAFEPSGRHVEGQFKAYPPAPPGSAYNRTGQYGGSWELDTAVGSKSVVTELRNPTAYAGWVGSAERQARVHQNRWVTDIQLLTIEQPILLDKVRELLISGYVS